MTNTSLTMYSFSFENRRNSVIIKPERIVGMILLLVLFVIENTLSIIKKLGV